MLLLTTTAFLATEHIPWQAIIALPILFTAGMSLMDTSDGMSHRNLVDAFLVRILWRLAEAQVSQEVGRGALDRSCRPELLDRTLVWNQRHLMIVLREYEDSCNTHRPHRTLKQAAPLRPLPDGVTDLDNFRVQRRDRAGRY